MQTFFVHSYQSYLFNRILSLRVKEGLSLKEPEVGDFITYIDSTHAHQDEWLFVTDQNHEKRIEQVKSGEYGIISVIPGYTSKMPNTRQTEIVRKILREEGTKIGDFRFPKNKYLDSPGGFHNLTLDMTKVDAHCVDEGLRIRFSLRKGSYATVVLRELMKNDPSNRT
jgi:tRNA pseudouridine13 synthase